MGCVFDFITYVQNLGGPFKKKSETKNMQTMVQFQTTLNFDCKYLRNKWRYPQSEN